MYIIELIFKIKEKLTMVYKKDGLAGLFRPEVLMPQENSAKKEGFKAEENDVEAEYETCEHIFRPVDSTNTVLACVKCGFLIHCNEDEFKKKNIFENDINDKPND